MRREEGEGKCHRTEQSNATQVQAVVNLFLSQEAFRKMHRFPERNFPITWGNKRTLLVTRDGEVTFEKELSYSSSYYFIITSVPVTTV